MHPYLRFLLPLAAAFVLLSAVGPAAGQERPYTVEGEYRKWHPVTITFDGPMTSEDAAPNPFRDYRLDVTFQHAPRSRTFTVPGYYAADGQAAETGAAAGNKWRVHFTPDAAGDWTFTAAFRTGPDVALSPLIDAGRPTAFDGASGTFSISETDKRGRDVRSKGFLRHTEGRYLRFQNGDLFLKGGADSPENLLAYADFDQTYSLTEPGAERRGEARTAPLHRYAPHVRDWRPGDPSWQGGKGKGLIGALNYLASEGMNSVYFLTMNVEGDGKDVWPWTSPETRDRYDVSKLDQWNLVFDHMDSLGLMLHVLTQETENDQLLDGGALGAERKLYYRELVARFGHHPALTWNLGEENTNTDAERKAFAAYLSALDPYDHPIVVHTYPGDKEKVYTPLLGYPYLDGPSLQMGDMTETHAETIKWIERSAQAGRPWFVSLDEIGPANVGVMPDGPDTNQDAVRHHALWGNLMAGGAGVEWYFGYQHPHNDLNAEDWRSRDRMWDYTRHALDFFHQHLPFAEMTSADALTDNPEDYVLAKAGEVYAVYLPSARPTRLVDLPEGTYRIQWFNPRDGGPLRQGTVATISPAAGSALIGSPPADPDADWVALVKKI